MILLLKLQKCFLSVAISDRLTLLIRYNAWTSGFQDFSRLLIQSRAMSQIP